MQVDCDTLSRIFVSIHRIRRLMFYCYPCWLIIIRILLLVRLLRLREAWFPWVQDLMLALSHQFGHRWISGDIQISSNRSLFRALVAIRSKHRGPLLLLLDSSLANLLILLTCLTLTHTLRIRIKNYNINIAYLDYNLIILILSDHIKI